MKFLVLVVMFFFMSLFSLFAKEITVTVLDADLNIPLEGAAVYSWDGRQYECDGDGRARLEIPDGPQVVIRAGYPGYENGRLVISSGGADNFIISLRLAGVMENQELVVEAQKAGTGETRSGRSVAISGKDLSRTAEIGIVEDVMTSVKLLPGVGYSGYFNAMPSIRGGSPADLTAVLDGFYIERPYHWGGAVSVFDPKMVQSARLSHGVFSARYGHTISGLLEVSSRKPSSTEVELELGVSTSVTAFNLSEPLGGKGGVMVMGKVSYWDPFIWAVKQISADARAIKQAPYIRSGALSACYQLSPNLHWTLNGFFGTDGMGYERKADNIKEDDDISLNWNNGMGFLVTGLTYNPDRSTAIRGALGAGFRRESMNIELLTNLQGYYSNQFLADWGHILNGKTMYELLGQYTQSNLTDTRLDYQGRLDFDRDLGGGFLFSFGGQELYSQWLRKGEYSFLYEEKVSGLPVNGGYIPGGYIGYPAHYSVDAHNKAFISSAYTLVEYTTENKRFGAELGLRADHLYFVGRDFTIQTIPAFNPRLNLDFGILENAGSVDSLRATIGTGLFSSIDRNLQNLDKRSGVKNYELKQNRSWTSLGGVQINFLEGYSFNLEGYVKYVFDRAYQYATIDRDPAKQDISYKFDGDGIILGFDLILQKFTSRYWDGWISYSFTHARYRDPQNKAKENVSVGGNYSAGSDWYYPSFHRFHTLNLVLNLKPVNNFNIATRLGFVSGPPAKETGLISQYPVVIDPGTPREVILEKWKREEIYSDTKRGDFSLPLDIKFSFYRFDKKGKVQSEIYLAMENLLSLIYKPKGNSTVDSATGKEESGSYEMPVPLLSFGFKWSY
jgi:hypothetical protein